MHPINQNIITEYAKKYPSAGSENIDALFRYSSYNPEQIDT